MTADLQTLRPEIPHPIPNGVLIYMVSASHFHRRDRNRDWKQPSSADSLASQGIVIQSTFLVCSADVDELRNALRSCVGSEEVSDVNYTFRVRSLLVQRNDDAEGG